VPELPAEGKGKKMAVTMCDLHTLLWLASLEDGGEDFIGDEYESYTLMKFRHDDHEKAFFSEIAEEQRLDVYLPALEKYAGAIVYIDDSGFVDVALYEIEDELMEEWEYLQNEFKKFADKEA